MPQTQSAKKALRVAQRRRAINDRWRSKVRETLKKFRQSVASGDTKQMETAYTEAQKTIDRAARRNALHKNAAARKKSRLRATITRTATK